METIITKRVMANKIKDIKKAFKKVEDLYLRYHNECELLHLLIDPYINNDIDGLDDGDISVHDLAGDGIALMFDDTGVSIEEIIDRISHLNDGDKINISELMTYL